VQTTNDKDDYAQYNGYDVRYTQKTSAKQTESLALFVVDKVKGQTLKHQKLITEYFLCHPLIKEFIHPYLEDIALLKQN
jgi:hypothetical protein